MMVKKIGLIGLGKMLSYLLIAAKDSLNDFELYCYTPSCNISKEVRENVAKLQQIDEIKNFPLCDIYFLGFKPQHLKQVAQAWKNHFNQNSKATIVSILAAIKTSRLIQSFGCQSVMRIMPNTPVRVGKGVCLIFKNMTTTSVDDLFFVDQFLKQGSSLFYLEKEENIDALTTITGCSPAYMFEFAHYLKNFISGKISLDDKLLRALITKSLLGACQLMDQSQESFEQLRDQVVSKGGVTQVILAKWQEKELEKIIESSLESGVERALELQDENTKIEDR